MQPKIEHLDNYGEPDLRFVAGVAHVPDLEIAAALLSLSGAAWDGHSAPTYKPEDSNPEKLAEWQAALNEPTTRQIEADFAGTHKAIVMLPVIRKDGWTAKDGKHYAENEPAPTPRVICELKARYLYRTDGRVTRAIEWNERDWRWWWMQWFTPGGLLSGARTHSEKRKMLLTEFKERHGIVSKLSVFGGGHE